MKPLLLLLLALTLGSLPAQAREDGGEGLSGGGDEIGLEFEKSFDTALALTAKNFPELAAKMKAAGLARDSEAMVVVTEKNIQVEKNGVTQESVAENYPSRKLILVNRARWQAITNPRVKQGIALHEYAGLLKLENTGNYVLSAEYVSKFGLSEDALTTSDLARLRVEQLAKQLRLAFRESAGRSIFSNEYSWRLDSVGLDDDVVFYTSFDQMELSMALADGWKKMKYKPFLRGEEHWVTLDRAIAQFGSDCEVVSGYGRVLRKTGTSFNCIAKAILALQNRPQTKK
ncbi:MAG: hypothetical protein ACXWQO_07245 [Bdellovibrionota bacterium]